MKHQIFGREAGTDDAMTVLLVVQGSDATDRPMDDDHTLAGVRAAVNTYRERGYEGYVMFAGDPTHYGFTPEADIVYPAAAD
ncbi:hypothetical protein [Burkholderia gladioli]|uniref:hypothetical protein n=1 Tax=Burkholderia gladioli TaxID=28095 RepID=UPI001640D9FC|nr:hypothetical protein [Burkholderia gladioli]MBU9218893.1 hypothetical protein [Burkholderia gladioli]MBW5286797.1 hypothetical protein [Burkholderia gladioli]